MSGIFICYSSVDQSTTEQLAHLLRKAYEPVWYDEHLIGGEPWWEEILRQINACVHFVFLMSNDALNSEWCQKEVAEAHRLNKNIIPVIIRRKTQIPEELRQRQMIDMEDGITVEGLSELFAALIRYIPPKSPAEAREKQRRADQRLLERLWPFINGRYVEVLDNQVQAARVDWELYTSHVVKYLDLRGKAQNHFADPALEEAFEAFDDSLIQFDGQIAWTYELEEVNGHRYMGKQPPQADDRYWRQKYDKLVRMLLTLRRQHVELARAIQAVLPGYTFPSDE